MKHGVDQANMMISPPPAPLTLARYRALAERNRRSMPKGSSVFCVGDPARGLFLVLEGVMEIHMPSSNGEMWLSHLMWPGQWIAAEATLEGGLHFAGAYARTDLEVGVLSYNKVLELAAQDGALWRELGMIATHDQRVASRALNDAILRDPTERIIATLLRLTDGHQNRSQRNAGCLVPISQAELAMIANLCRNTTHKVLGQLAEKSFVTLSYRGIEISCFDRLEQHLHSLQN